MRAVVLTRTVLRSGRQIFTRRFSLIFLAGFSPDSRLKEYLEALAALSGAAHIAVNRFVLGSHVELPRPLSSHLPIDRQHRLTVTLPLLREALADARQHDRDPWQFAVTAAELLDAGMRVTDLRWLVACGAVAHAEEESRPGRVRSFCPSCELSVTPRSCFVLTEHGERLFRGLPTTERETIIVADGSARPCWDRVRRVLCWRGQPVKRFPVPARNQELILAAFEEEEWPPRIDDPLPGIGSRLAGRQRLRETVRSLNRNQGQVRVRFTRDGTGQGVCWAA